MRPRSETRRRRSELCRPVPTRPDLPLPRERQRAVVVDGFAEDRRGGTVMLACDVPAHNAQIGIVTLIGRAIIVAWWYRKNDDLIDAFLDRVSDFALKPLREHARARFHDRKRP